MPDASRSSAGTDEPLSVHVVELLGWIAARPRTYGDTMEAWRTSCPRMPAWEDATLRNLVEVVPGDGVGIRAHAVRLTALGEAVLASHGPSPRHADEKRDRAAQ
jgi:hypothetical protein